MKITVNFVRVFVGLLFIFSGLIKANDPLGLAYKMDEYFNVWNMSWASSFSLFLSISMNIFEIVAGVALIIGFKPKLVTPLLLILIIFFTYLTGYAVLSGKIKTCGCFGDCIPLEAYQSFIKDLILLVLIVFLYIKRQLITPWFNPKLSALVVSISFAIVGLGQGYVLKNLPIVDCLPYAAGKDLLAQMKPAPGSIPDSTATYFVYKKNGQNVTFDANNFPEDFDEDIYEYVDRETKIIRKGNADIKIQDFTLYDDAGTNITEKILSQQFPYILFFAKGFDGQTPEWNAQLKEITQLAFAKKIPVYLVTNEPTVANEFFNKKENSGISILRLDGTVMKTMLRSPVGIVHMNGPIVIKKYSENNIRSFIKTIK